MDFTKFPAGDQGQVTAYVGNRNLRKTGETEFFLDKIRQKTPDFQTISGIRADRVLQEGKIIVWSNYDCCECRQSLRSALSGSYLTRWPAIKS